VDISYRLRNSRTVAGGCDFPHRRAIVPALKELATEGEAKWHLVDVADGKSVARLIETVMGEHGRLDYAFNNDGSGGRSA
jgi:NAD(P)-dependent dehydrogenase (short-subunit alcohol dehydrogenase family)